MPTEAFETRPQWIERAPGDFEVILSRVSHYRTYQGLKSSLIGVALQSQCMVRTIHSLSRRISSRYGSIVHAAT